MGIDLYKFENLSSWLDEKGFPDIKQEKQDLIVRDVTKEAVEKGHIEFLEDGIYWVENRRRIKGFVYISHAYVYFKGRGPKFPKFHITRCETIDEFLNDNRFDLRYKFSNKESVDIIDRTYKREYSGMKLTLCMNCQKIAGYGNIDTSNFIRRFA